MVILVVLTTPIFRFSLTISQLMAKAIPVRLTETSHLSDGHRVAVQYEYDKQGRMNLERQTVQHPETGEL
ncbi:hypothetical protein D7W26_23570, partial [Salmonella enterica subsp. enterica serovar Liverpool]|nr:hypothetical protein [Salmonella enterica subsp. enterica serovar Liverpool]